MEKQCNIFRQNLAQSLPRLKLQKKIIQKLRQQPVNRYVIASGNPFTFPYLEIHT